MNNLNTLSSNEDIKDKIIFLRVDFNIPIKDGKVIDDTKIVNMKDIINKLLSKKTKIILCSHLGRPQKNGKDGLSLDQVKLLLVALGLLVPLSLVAVTVNV
jgi:phosphoglycerate kinase